MASHSSATLLAYVTPATSSANTPAIMVRDMDNGGNGRIAGTVKEVGTPDAPVIRRVRLYRKLDGMMLRETWSHADGAYSFTGIAIQLCYVTAFDHTGNYNAVIKDSIMPEVTP